MYYSYDWLATHLLRWGQNENAEVKVVVLHVSTLVHFLALHMVT